MDCLWWKQPGAKNGLSSGGTGGAKNGLSSGGTNAVCVVAQATPAFKEYLECVVAQATPAFREYLECVKGICTS